MIFPSKKVFNKFNYLSLYTQRYIIVWVSNSPKCARVAMGRSITSYSQFIITIKLAVSFHSHKLQMEYICFPRWEGEGLLILSAGIFEGRNGTIGMFVSPFHLTCLRIDCYQFLSPLKTLPAGTRKVNEPLGLLSTLRAFWSIAAFVQVKGGNIDWVYLLQEILSFVEKLYLKFHWENINVVSTTSIYLFFWGNDLYNFHFLIHCFPIWCSSGLYSCSTVIRISTNHCYRCI